jgi:type VI secretion system protein ImpA
MADAVLEVAESAEALAPISEEAPCGPDLDLEGDPDFLNFMAGAEGMLPAAYFSFDRKAIDFPTLFETGNKLLARTRDIRLLVTLAKFDILNRDLQGFAKRIETVDQLLLAQWDGVHPRAEDGDYIARMSQLSTLEDSPVVLQPLQHAPLAETQREGAVTYRAQLIASGEIKPREGETAWTAAMIEKVLQGTDLPALAKTSETLLALKDAIARIRATSIERAGFDQAVSFDALPKLVDKIAVFVHGALVKRDPNAAPLAIQTEFGGASGDDAGAAAPIGDFATMADADAALAGALAYFTQSEPSSPAVLLIGQARALLGRNLFDVMRILVPSYADTARISVGAEPTFNVPVNSISATEAGESGESPPEITPAASRAAALALVDKVAAHLRKVEPSSPVPHLCDRVKALAGRDFLGLLKELFTEDTLTAIKSGG